MLRTYKMKPNATVSNYPSAVNPATSGYPWLGSGSTTPHEVWRENDESDPTVPGNDEKWVYCWPTEYGLEHQVSFEPGPTLALFTKLTIRARFDYCQTGPNNWFFDPVTHGGPGIKLGIRRRNKTDWAWNSGWQIGIDYTGTGGPDLTDYDAFNTRLTTEGDIWSVTPWLEAEWTSHPDGGVFTLEDINNIAAGVSFLWDEQEYPPGSGQMKAFNPTQGSFFKIRVPNLVVKLTIQDLGGYIRATRHNASATLRLNRKARSTIQYTVPVIDDTKEIGEVVNLTHYRGADSGGEGWGPRPLERRNGWIVQRTYWPEGLKTVNLAYDLHDFNCEAWGAFRIPIPWTPELSGMAYLDRGGEFEMDRAQDAWSLRPGDGAALRVLEDYPNLSEEGLAIHSASGTEVLTYNANLGNAVWYTATTGGATFTAETKLPMADELGYSDSVILSFGGTPGTASKAQVFAATAGDTLSVRVRVRNIAVDDPGTKYLQVVLESPGGTSRWNDKLRTWDANPPGYYNPIPSDEGFGEIVMDQIPCPATGDYVIRIGRMSAAINTATFGVALVSVQKNAPGCGMPLVTLDSTIARVGDVWTMDNSSPYTFWHRDRGMVIVDFRPFWRAGELSPGTTKTIIRADHESGYYDEVRFVAGATDQLVFERVDSVGTRTVSLDILDSYPGGSPLKITRSNYLRVYARWLDSQGWRDRAPYEASVGFAAYNLDAYNEFIVSSEEWDVWAAPDATLEDAVKLQGLDGWVRWLEVKRNPLTGQEALWRR